MVILGLAAGFILLTAGAEVLVRGATGLARVVGLPSLIIGLTVVAFGTSAPEFAVSIKAGLAGQADIALGNVVGSNVFNVLFILGISSVIIPLTASSQLIRLDVPVMIGASGLAWLLALNGSIGRVEGAGLFLGIVAYTALLIYLGKRTSQQSNGFNDKDRASPHKTTGLVLSVLFVLIGLVLLVLGSRWLVDAAVESARILGVSELMISVTIVSAGTSMPEVATSVVASIRGERNIAIGNVVGSCIFNIMAVLGAAAWMAPQGVAISPAALRFDIPVMMATAVICLPIFFTGGRISRWEGVMLLAYYGAYVATLILNAGDYACLVVFRVAMFWFVIPMSVLGVFTSVLLWIRRNHAPVSDQASD